MQNFESSDDHWEKSLAASAEARRQAHMVEEQSQATHAKLLAAQQATRDFDKARREHMALEVCDFWLTVLKPLCLHTTLVLYVTCGFSTECHVNVNNTAGAAMGIVTDFAPLPG